MNKAIVTREAILKINPEAKATVYERGLKLAEIDEVIEPADIIMPAMDDWPLSLMVFRAAKRLGKPAVMAYPVGALGRACTFLPDSPLSAEECLAMPFGLPYDELEEYMENPDARQVLQYYMTEGAWREEWFDRWCEGGSTPRPNLHSRLDHSVLSGYGDSEADQREVEACRCAVPLAYNTNDCTH